VRSRQLVQNIEKCVYVVVVEVIVVDRRLRSCPQSWIRSRRYDGVEVLRTLNVSRATL